MELENYGVILESLEDVVKDNEDYLFGSSKVSHNIELKPEESFRPYFSDGEVQHGVYFDSMSCVTFAALNSIEAILNYQITNKLISNNNINWLRRNGYFNKNGLIDFSDRFIASVSGTTRSGNSGSRVNQAIRDYGLVPETLWPYPRDQRTPVFDWGEYIKTPDKKCFDMGIEFKKRFKINDEIVYANSFLDAKRRSPIHCFVHAWPSPVNGIFPRTTNGINHAITYFDERFLIHDTYINSGSFDKRLAPDYIFHPFGYAYTINELNMTNVKVIKDSNSPAVGFWLPPNNPDGLISMARNYGIDIPRRSDNSIDWDSLIDGYMNLKINTSSMEDFNPEEVVETAEEVVTAEEPQAVEEVVSDVAVEATEEVAEVVAEDVAA